MIVANEEQSRAYLASGVWGRVTLDQILRRNAQSTPDRLAVSDFGDRHTWTGGDAVALTYAELDRRVEAVAAFFAGLGLQPDTVMAVQMPPTTDAVVVFFAALRAGLILAPLPLAIRENEALERMSSVGAKAIVTVAETAGELHGERMRTVAAELFQIRFVFGAGPDIPDGLIGLDRVYEEASRLGSAAEIVRKGNPADHAASLCWAFEPQGDTVSSVVLPRSHNHWIATGLMTLLEGRIEKGSTIVSPFALSGLAGIGAALMPWLLASGTLVLGMPSSVDRIVEEVAHHGASHVLSPARFARRVGDRLEAYRADATIVVVAGERNADAAMGRWHKVVDVVTLAERALVARSRRDGAAPMLPIGTVAAPADTSVGPTLVETRIKATAQKAGNASDGALLTGELLIRGAMVPEEPWQKAERGLRPKPRENDGWIRTGLQAKLATTQPPGALLGGRAGDVAGMGQIEISLDELDQLYKSAGDVLDAAAISIREEDGGEHLAAVVVPRPGTSFDEESYLATLESYRIGLHRLPARVFAVPAIARAPSGRVMRSGMAAHLVARR